MDKDGKTDPSVGSTLSRQQILRALQAMKCMAARIAGTTGDQSDAPDIRFLIRHLKLKGPEVVLDLVARYYPTQEIPVKTRYLVEGLFEEGEV